jgi:hypothetical protein
MHMTTVAELQCERRVGRNGEEIHDEPLHCLYSVTTVLKRHFPANLGWVVAHPAHPLAPPLHDNQQPPCCN